MSLLDKASLIVTPNAISAGKLHSVIPADGSGDMTVVRGTNATRINSAGLVEIPRTNLLTRSEEFNDVSWSKLNGSSVTSDTIISPDGTQDADTIIFSSSTSSQVVKSQTVVSGITYTFSVYLKVASGTLTLRLSGVASGVLNTITITDQWVRYSFTQVSNSTSAFPGIWGNGLASSVFAWGAQLETSNVATEYIPTVASIRTSFAGITQDGASASNIARLNYETVGGCPAILIEPQRTNLLVNSVLSGTGATPTSWAIGIQTGTSTPVQSIKNLSINAYRFITSNTRQEFSQTFNLALNSISFFSVFVESVTTPIPVSQMLRVNPIAGGASTQVFFKNNIVITSSTIIEAGFTYTLQVTCTVSDSFQFRMGCGTMSNVTGDVTLSMPQLETGVSPVNAYPTSYIPTFGSAQTRNADNINKTGVSALIGQTEGTVFAHFKFTNVGIEKYIILINDASTVNQIAIRRLTTGEIRAVFGATTVSGTTNASSAILPNGTYKIAYKYISGSLKLFINGALSFSLTPTFTFGSLLDNIRIGNDTGTAMPLGDSITSIQLYKTVLTDTECINLTTL